MSPTKRKSNIGPLTTTAIKMRQLIKDETPEQREARLQNARVRMATYLANETEAQRERRLTYSRKYSKIITARRKRQKLLNNKQQNVILKRTRLPRDPLAMPRRRRRPLQEDKQGDHIYAKTMPLQISDISKCTKKQIVNYPSKIFYNSIGPSDLKHFDWTHINTTHHAQGASDNFSHFMDDFLYPAEEQQEKIIERDSVALYTTIKINGAYYLVYKKKRENVKVQVDMRDCQELIETDQDLCALTGIKTLNVLENIVIALKQLHPDLPFGKSHESNVIITFMKLKLDTSNSFLAVLFKLSSIEIENIFYNTVNSLCSTLESAVTLRRNLTERFAHFPEAILLLHFFSLPKKLKIMIGLNPAGMICFISQVGKCHEESAEMFQRSNILSVLVEGDSVVTPEAVRVNYLCEKHNVHLIRPILVSESDNKFESNPIDSDNLWDRIRETQEEVDHTMQRLNDFKCMSTLSKVTRYQDADIEKFFSIIVASINLSLPVFYEDHSLCILP